SRGQVLEARDFAARAPSVRLVEVAGLVERLEARHPGVVVRGSELERARELSFDDAHASLSVDRQSILERLEDDRVVGGVEAGADALAGDRLGARRADLELARQPLAPGAREDVALEEAHELARALDDAPGLGLDRERQLAASLARDLLEGERRDRDVL